MSNLKVFSTLTLLRKVQKQELAKNPARVGTKYHKGIAITTLLLVIPS